MKTIFIGVIVVALIILGILVISPWVSEILYYGKINDQNQSLREKYGGDSIVDKYGTLCTTTTYRGWDNTCDFSLGKKPLPASEPAQSTLDWLDENKEFNQQIILDPSFENCDLAKRSIIAIQGTIDLKPVGDANSEIYQQGIDMYQDTIDAYCK